MSQSSPPTQHSLRVLLICAGLTLCVATPVFTRAATIEERLDQLEQKVSSLTQENASLKKQLGYDAKGTPTAAVVLAQGKETKLALGGFLHLQGEAGDAADSRFPAGDRFLLRKVRLGARGSFSDTIDFSLTADLGNNSLNSTTAFRAQATDVFLLWKAYPAANVTVGQFKTPYGYEFLVSDVKTVAVERSLASDQLALGRQAGVMLSGVFFDKKLTYAAAVTNGNGADNSFNDNEQFTYVGRVAGTVFENKQAKVSVGTDMFSGQDTGSFTGRRTGEGVDAQVAFAGAEITGELLHTHFNRLVGADYDARGWSVQGTYFIVPNQWQAVARYESYDPSNLALADRTNLRTLGFNYLIKGDDLKLSVDYLIGNPPEAKSHEDRFLARLQVIF